MSDFDKYFAERLDEEGQFPNREKNWKTMSKHLDAFDAGVRGHTAHLRYWQAAAAVSVIAIGLLFGKMHQMHRDIAKLQEQIAGLQQNINEPDTHPSPARSSVPLEKNDGLGNGLLQGWQPPGLKWFVLPKSFVQYPDIEPASIASQSNEGAFAQKSSEEPNDVTSKWQTIPGQQSEAGEKDIKEKISALTPLPVDIATPGCIEAAPVFIKTTSIQSSLIKPVRHNFSKFRVGVQTSLGLPKPRGKGISSLNGAGVTAEYTLLPNLRLSASADWMRHEINSDTFQARDHFPHTHPKPKFGYKLSQVEGSQRSQYYTLGVSYSLPIRFPLRPVLRVAHTWVHWSSSMYNFEFEKKWGFFPPFSPKHDYEPRTSASEWLKNNWRIGAGLEYETSRLVAGVWADYSTNTAANDPVFDILFLRAGVEYKFD